VVVLAVTLANPATLTLTQTVSVTVTSYVVVVLDHTKKKVAEFYLNPSTLSVETLFYAAYNPSVLDALLSTVPPPPSNARLPQPPREPPSGVAVRVWAQQWYDYISKLLDVEQRRAWLRELAEQRGRRDALKSVEEARSLDELYRIQLELERG